MYFFSSAVKYFSKLDYLMRSFSSLFFLSLSSAAFSAFTAWIDLQWFSATWEIHILGHLSFDASCLGPVLVCLVLGLPGQLVPLDLVHAVEDQLHQRLRLLNRLLQGLVLGQQVEHKDQDLMWKCVNTGKIQILLIVIPACPGAAQVAVGRQLVLAQ